MAANGYRQPYGYTPSSARQQSYNVPYGQQYDDHYEDQYGDRAYERGTHNDRGHGMNRGPHGYVNQRYNQPDYQFDDDQYERYRQQDDGQYRDTSFQGHYDEQPQLYEQERREQKFYQYDDRYRANDSSRSNARVYHGPPPMRSGEHEAFDQNNQYENIPQRQGRLQHGYENTRQPPRERERILQQEPESPKNASWDNPFPTFPAKKKQAEINRSNSGGHQSVDPAHSAQLQDNQRPTNSYDKRLPPPETSFTDLPRPHTSHAQRNFQPSVRPSDMPPAPNRQLPPITRPSTSHSQRTAEPFNTHTHLPPMPSRQQLRNPQHQPGFGQDDRSDISGQRPIPRRAVTGPVQPQPFHQHVQPDQAIPLGGGYSDTMYDEQPQSNHVKDQNLRGPQWDDNSEPGYRGLQRQLTRPAGEDTYTNRHRRRSSDQSYRKDSARETADQDPDSYRGVPLARKTSSDMPDFDAIPNGFSEKIEDHLGQPQRQQGQIYRKPVYQTNGPPQSLPQQQPALTDSTALVSPLAQFSFNLDQTDTPVTSEARSHTSAFDYGRNRLQDRGNPGQIPAPLSDRSVPPVQRNVSQHSTFSPDGAYEYARNRPSPGIPPVRPGLAQESQHPRNTREDLGYNSFSHGYGGSESVQNDTYERRDVPSSQTSSLNDAPRYGYDQRLQPMAGFVPPQQVPIRPATSASGRPMPNTTSESRTSLDSYQRSDTQSPDSFPTRPAPFRPGLMQQAARSTPPPQPRQVSQPSPHQRISSGPSAPAIPDLPVTIQELNTLREEYKNRPNDYNLGLRFAKRLVEAAQVLADENGRADAKQTTKNRERYILDAHKIVKRLCSCSHPEAMFYLADCYGQGMLGLEADPKEAFSLYTSAAKLGHAQAAYRVAVCCELGSEEGGGTRRDPLKAVQWYKRAASLGDTPAMYKMGMILLKGLLSQPKGPREAISWLKRAAERADADNPHALHELGLLYENAQPNDIVLKDEGYALQLFQQAADLGYKYSQFRLGSAYEYGSLGLPIDPRMSIAWYSRAAKQGEHQSEFALSGWYLTGSGATASGEQPLLAQSDTEAYLWARKAAASGLAKAEYAMGYYTEAGIGVTSNIEEAKRWYYRAAAQNHPKARERLEDLKKGGQRMQKTRVSRSNVGKHNEGECVVM